MTALAGLWLIVEHSEPCRCHQVGPCCATGDREQAPLFVPQSSGLMIHVQPPCKVKT